MIRNKVFLISLLLQVPLLLINALLNISPLHWNSIGFNKFAVALQASNIPSLIDSIDDEDEKSSFSNIVSNYLIAKYRDCNADGENCRFSCNSGEFEELLRTVLPPLTPKELKSELELLLSRSTASSGEVSQEEFVNIILSNSYWREAGVFVIKELIFLDCLYEFYYKRRSILNDDDYSTLKDQLTWNGSMTVSLKANEALFISAVTAYRKGRQIMNDVEYGALKSQLLNERSWVVKREQDPLEKLGLNTFLGYLHRSM